MRLGFLAIGIVLVIAAYVISTHFTFQGDQSFMRQEQQTATGIVSIVLFFDYAIGVILILVGIFTTKKKQEITIKLKKGEDERQALQILKRRYANGELTRAEYEDIRQELEEGK